MVRQHVTKTGKIQDGCGAAPTAGSIINGPENEFTSVHRTLWHLRTRGLKEASRHKYKNYTFKNYA